MTWSGRIKEYRRAAEITLEDDGGTFTDDGKLVLHHRGYLVGGVVPTAIVCKAGNDAWSLDWLAGQLGRFARQHAATLEQAGLYLGTWVDGDNVYIDVTQHFEHRDAALLAADMRGELAVWDCRESEEIRL